MLRVDQGVPKWVDKRGRCETRASKTAMYAPRFKVFLPRTTAGQYERQTCGVPVAGDAGGSPTDSSLRVKKTAIRHIYATVITSNPFERDDLFTTVWKYTYHYEAVLDYECTGIGLLQRMMIVLRHGKQERKSKM